MIKKKKIESERKFIMPLPHQINMPLTSSETRPNYLRDLIILHTGGWKPRLWLSKAQAASNTQITWTLSEFPKHYMGCKIEQVGGSEMLCVY